VKLVLVECVYDPSTRITARLRYEDYEFEAGLGYTASSRPAWLSTLSQKTNKQKLSTMVPTMTM
jgi:hypothetical protein